MHLPALGRTAEQWPPLVPRAAVRQALSISANTQRTYEQAGRLPRPIALTARRLVYERDALVAALARLTGGEVTP